MDQQPQSISRRVAQTLALSPQSGAVEFQGEWTTWAALRDAADKLEALLVEAGVPKDAPIGWIARNSPAAVAAFAALLLAGRPIAPLRPHQSVAGLPDEIAAQAQQAIVAEEGEWTLDGIEETARRTGSVGVTIAGRQAFSAHLRAGLEKPGPGPHRPPTPSMVVERVSSGTTGAPKRIPVSSEALLLALRTAEIAASSRRMDPVLRLKTSPAVVVQPFSHASGVFALLFALYQARPIVLLERFTVDGWVEAVRRHLQAIGRICEGAPDAGPIAQLPRRGRFHWLTATRSSIIQTSPVHMGRCSDPSMSIERLFERMVRS